MDGFAASLCAEVIGTRTTPSASSWLLTPLRRPISVSALAPAATDGLALSPDRPSEGGDCSERSPSQLLDGATVRSQPQSALRGGRRLR
eukprot:429751-Pyramimonas_sp.AAC.1